MYFHVLFTQMEYLSLLIFFSWFSDLVLLQFLFIHFVFTFGIIYSLIVTF